MNPKIRANLVKWAMPSSGTFKYDWLKSILINSQHDLATGIPLMFVELLFPNKYTEVVSRKVVLIYPKCWL